MLTTDQLRQLADYLERVEEFLGLIDVDEDGIFNITRNGQLLGFGPTAKDAVWSAINKEDNDNAK